MKIEKIKKKLVEIALEIAKEEKGCLFVIEEKPVDYKNLVNQDIKSFSIFDNQSRRRLKLLGTHDGACIFDLEGNLIAYGVTILNIKVYPGFGTRHSAAYTASLYGNTIIMSSEEDRKVKILKGGKFIMQIDALERNVEKKAGEAVSWLESTGVGTLASLGVSIFAPAIGITLTSGIIVFGASHYLVKQLIAYKNGK